MVGTQLSNTCLNFHTEEGRVQRHCWEIKEGGSFLVLFSHLWGVKHLETNQERFLQQMSLCCHSLLELNHCHSSDSCYGKITLKGSLLLAPIPNPLPEQVTERSGLCSLSLIPAIIASIKKRGFKISLIARRSKTPNWTKKAGKNLKTTGWALVPHCWQPETAAAFGPFHWWLVIASDASLSIILSEQKELVQQGFLVQRILSTSVPLSPAQHTLCKQTVIPCMYFVFLAADSIPEWHTSTKKRQK